MKSHRFLVWFLLGVVAGILDWFHLRFTADKLARFVGYEVSVYAAPMCILLLLSLPTLYAVKPLTNGGWQTLVWVCLAVVFAYTPVLFLLK